MIRLGILGSTRGTHMLAIAAAIQQKKLDASIAVVISNKRDALVLERAAACALHAKFIDPTGLTRNEYDHLVSAELHQNHVDLIALVGYMRILSEDFVLEWQDKIINVHPSLLPQFAGLMDLSVHQAVLQSG